MGQCGCGDFGGDFRFQGPDGAWYVLDTYASCRDCDTPAGVTLYRFTAEQMAKNEFGVRSIPVLTPTYEGIGVPILHPDKLIKRLADRDDADEYDSLGDFATDAVREEFREAVFATVDAWRRSIERGKHRR